MYILLESTHGCITQASISDIDCIGTVETENEAIAWRNSNIDYREYKYVSET